MRVPICVLPPQNLPNSPACRIYIPTPPTIIVPPEHRYVPEGRALHRYL